MNRRGFLISLASLLIGAGMVCAMPPWNCWPCMVIGFSLFYVVLDKVQTRRFALLQGWLFGFGYFAVGLYWIANALLVPGNPFKWVWPLTIAGLPALLACFPAFGAFLAVRFSRRRFGGYLMFVAAFAISEWLRGHLFSGYPWNSFGYTWTGWLAMAQTAAFGGAYFLTALTIAWSAMPGFLFLWRGPARWKIGIGAIAAAVFAICWAGGASRLSAHPTQYDDTIEVRAVQANISQADKWDPAKGGDNINRELALSEPPPDDDGKTTILVWPETALDQDALTAPNVRAALRGTLDAYHGKTYLMTGLFRWTVDRAQQEHNFNSFVLFDHDLAPLMVYDKTHLVPFGEYIPLQKYIPMNPFVKFGSFDTGIGPTTFNVAGLPGFTPLICYEIIFPGAVTGTPAPAWIVNITNDAWYGDSPGPRQHFGQTQFRAIEEGVPVVRASATGESGVIDAYGRVVAEVPLGQAGVAASRLPRPSPVPTPYHRFGDVMFFVFVLAFAIGGRVAIRKDSV